MKNIKENYEAIRKSAALFIPTVKIFQINDIDSALDSLSKVVSGKVHLLEPYKILNSLILDDNGGIVDICFLMLFDDKLWIITYSDHNELENSLKKYCSDLNYEVVTDQYQVIALEGPYSWKIAKAAAGLEIIGLPFLNFMDSQVAGVPLVLARMSISGEYGYRFIVSRDQSENVIEALKSTNAATLTVFDDYTEIRNVLEIQAAEMRMPYAVNSLFSPGDSPVVSELRWMIEFRKDDYIGKSAIENEITNYKSRMIGFVCEASVSETDFHSVASTDITYNGNIIGKVKSSCYSPKMEKVIGYALIEKEWAYANIDNFSINVKGQDVSIRTISTPFFLADSSFIAME